MTGLAEGPIPFTAVVEYFKIYRIGKFEDFKYLIHRMDSAYLRIQRDREKKNTKSGSKPSATNNANKTNKNKR